MNCGGKCFKSIFLNAGQSHIRASSRSEFDSVRASYTCYNHCSFLLLKSLNHQLPVGRQRCVYKLRAVVFVSIATIIVNEQESLILRMLVSLAAFLCPVQIFVLARI